MRKEVEARIYWSLLMISVGYWIGFIVSAVVL